MPKYQYKTLSNIETKVKTTASKLDISSKGIQEAINEKRNFYITKTKHQGEKVIFKARIADHRVLQQWGKKFQNERRFLKTLTKDFPNDNIINYIPKYLRSGSKSPEWLMYQYIEKKPLGTSWSYSHPYKKDIPKIIELLQALRSFPIKEFRQKYPWAQNIEYFNSSNYLAYFNKINRQRKKKYKEILDDDLLLKAHRIILRKRRLLSDSAIFLTHGDFTPGNIFINENAALIDWEAMRIDNLAFDITTLWFRTINHRAFRKALLLDFAKSVPNKREFQELFRLNILARLPAELWEWVEISQKSQPCSKRHQEAVKMIERCKKNYFSAIKGEELEKYE